MNAHRIWILTTITMTLLAMASLWIMATDLNLMVIRNIGVTFKGDIAANPEIITFLTNQAGVPAWEVSGKTISETLNRYPQVKSHRITRSHPNELNIDIELKSPIAEIFLGSESLFLDDAGIPFPSDPKYNLEIPRFNLKIGGLTASSNGQEPDGNICRLVLILTRNSYWTGYRSIQWLNHRDIRIQHRDHGNIIRLQRRDFDTQLDRLNRYLTAMPETTGTEFDMRFRNTLIIREDKGAVTIG